MILQIIIIKNGQKEVNNALEEKKPISILDMALFLALIDMPNSNGYVWEHYIEAIIKYNADQIYRQCIINIQKNKENNIDDDGYQNLIKKQQNTKLCINDGKISGAVDNQIIGINNLAKIEGIKRFDKNAKVKFVSIHDEKQTKMCESLDSQEFHVHDWNEFKRYSKTNDSLVKYRCYGLVVGLNCPPINDGFHYCRSYIVYLPVEKDRGIEYNISNYLRTKIIKNYKNALNDLKIIQKEYYMLPKNVKERLEKEGITIRLNDNIDNSGYNPKTKEIYLLPDLEEGEFIHEIGHTLEYIQNIRTNKTKIYHT